MGMESYNLLFLHENSRIVYNDRNCWKILSVFEDITKF